MADLSDVTAYLAQQASLAVYPNGNSLSSVANMDCIVHEGWPLGRNLDLDINGLEPDPTDPTGKRTIKRPNGPCAHVSIFPMQGTGKVVYQILDETYTITPPAINLSFTITGSPVTVSGGGTTINVTGQPATGEYLTIVADQQHIFSAGGTTTAALLSALLNQVQVNYPSATATASTITVPVNAYLTVRQGGQAIQGKVIHRQCNQVMVTVWAPNRVVRNQLSAAIDNLIKQHNKVSMPDTSQALVIYSRTNTLDNQQAESIYRRDLIYDVEYATVYQFPAYPVTSVQTSIINPNGTTATATAVT